MKTFNFGLPQNIIFGKESIHQLGDILKKLGTKGVFIISGPHLNQMGVVKKVENLCVEAGVKVASFTKTEANPSVETVEDATNAYKESGADCLIALGGGSPMDVAKAVGVLLSQVGVTEDKIPEMAGDAMKSGNILVNPRATTLEDIRMLYKKAM